MSGGRPVRPQGRDYGREMCEIDEEIGHAVGCRVEEEHRGEEGAEEEGLVPKIKKITTKPTAEEVEQHMATHIPFREWCPHCVAGKSKIGPRLLFGCF